MGVTQLSKKTGLKALKAIRDSTDEILDYALDKVTGAMVVDAKATVHVVTGELRDSIDHKKIDAGHWQVEATAPHAGYEEKPGVTRNFEGHPYLEPSVLAHVDDVKNIVNSKAAEVAEQNAHD